MTRPHPVVFGWLLMVSVATAGGLRDVGFQTKPGRTVGGVPLGRSVDDQGGTNGDVRVNTVLNNGARGWFVSGNGNTFDEEIVEGVAHSGNQALRVSNRFTSGIVNSLVMPWMVRPAGETGRRDCGGTGEIAVANMFLASFWFRTVADSAANACTGRSSIAISPDDGQGSRCGGYLALEDTAGAFKTVWYNTGQDTNAPGGSWYGYTRSPGLDYGRWYQFNLAITFVDGNGMVSPGTHNDIVRLNVRDASGATVWSLDENTVYPVYDNSISNNPYGTQTGITTWEDAPWNGTNGIGYAMNSLQMRMVSAPNSVPLGYYFDDFVIRIGDLYKYSTSFERRTEGTIMGIR